MPSKPPNTVNSTKAAEVAAAAGVSIYQIKVTRKSTNPPIWRRVLAPADPIKDTVSF